MNLHKRSCCSTWAPRKINMEFARDFLPAKNGRSRIKEFWSTIILYIYIFIYIYIYPYHTHRDIYIYTHSALYGFVLLYLQERCSTVQVFVDEVPYCFRHETGCFFGIFFGIKPLQTVSNLSGKSCASSGTCKICLGCAVPKCRLSSHFDLISQCAF